MFLLTWRRLRHLTQALDGLPQVAAGRENGNDVAHPADAELHRRVGIGEVRRYADGLAVARFEGARSGHSTTVKDCGGPKVVLKQKGVNTRIYKSSWGTAAAISSALAPKPGFCFGPLGYGSVAG